MEEDTTAASDFTHMNTHTYERMQKTTPGRTPASRDLEFEKGFINNQKSHMPLGGAIYRIFKIPSQSPLLCSRRLFWFQKPCLESVRHHEAQNRISLTFPYTLIQFRSVDPLRTLGDPQTVTGSSC